MPKDRRGRNVESVRVILDLAVREQAAEIERIRAIDAKTSPLFAGATAAIGIVAGLLGSPAPFPLAVWAKGIMVVALGYFIIAHWFCLQAIRIRTYYRAQPGAWNSPDLMRQEAGQVMAVLISTYEENLRANGKVRERKAQAHELAVRFLAYGVWALAAAFLTAWMLAKL